MSVFDAPLILAPAFPYVWQTLPSRAPGTVFRLSTKTYALPTAFYLLPSEYCGDCYMKFGTPHVRANIHCAETSKTQTPHSPRAFIKANSDLQSWFIPNPSASRCISWCRTCGLLRAHSCRRSQAIVHLSASFKERFRYGQNCRLLM